MTDSNKKPASATPGKPAGRTTPATTAPGAPAEGKTRTGPKGLKVAAGTKSSKASGKAAGKGAGKSAGKGAGKSGKAVKPVKPKRNAIPDATPVPVVALSPAKRALAWTHTARFLTTASQLHHLPQNGVLPGAEPDADQDIPEDLDDLDDDLIDQDLSLETEDGDADAQTLPARVLPEIAFVGRSNAGKSTAINRLAQQKRLAFASKTPGRTQHINLFVLGPKDEPDALFADLPGYGYAAVAREAKLRWQRVMADYLRERESLSGVVLMVDSRLGLTDLDKQLLEFVSERVTAGEVSLLVLLTKADKLNRKEGAAILAQVQKDLGVLATEDSDIAISLFSALSNEGLDDAAELIYEWAHREPRVLRGDDEDDIGGEDGDETDDDADDEGAPKA